MKTKYITLVCLASLLMLGGSPIGLRAQNLFNGSDYRVYTTIGGVNYFLADNGQLSLATYSASSSTQVWTISSYESTTGNELEKVAYTFVNKSTGNYFKNTGRLQGYDETVWTSHAIYYNDTINRYAIRMTNNKSAMYQAQYYMSVSGTSLLTTSASAPTYIWHITPAGETPLTDIALSEAGTLSTYVTKGDASVSSLTLSGKINGTDIALIRTLKGLKSLNLERAYIVSGGEAYSRSYMTANNEVGDSMFTGLHLQALVLPQATQRIGHCALRDCDSLTAITIPAGVTSIGRHAFTGCTQLATVKFLARNCATDCFANNLYYPPFRGCPLKSVTFGSDVAAIPDALLWDVDGTFLFASLALPQSLTTIGHYAFYGCKSLATVTIPTGVTSLGRGAFAHAPALTKVVYKAVDCSAAYSDGDTFYLPFAGCMVNSVSFGDSVQTLPAGLFWNKDKSFGFVAITLPASLKSIGDYTFSGCKLIAVRLPLNLTSLGRNAFYDCYLMSKVILNSINCGAGYVESDSLYYSPFMKCPISTVEIGDAVTDIPQGLFWDTSSSFTFTGVTLPASIKRVGVRAFRECIYLNNVSCAASTPPAIDFNAFYGDDLENSTLTVPTGCTENYRTLFPWSLFGTFNETNFQ